MFLGLEWYWWLVTAALILSIPFKVKFIKWWSTREQGRKKERLDTIRRMLKAGMYKEQIISLGYSEEEFAESENAEAENTLCAR